MLCTMRKVSYLCVCQVLDNYCFIHEQFLNECQAKYSHIYHHIYIIRYTAMIPLLIIDFIKCAVTGNYFLKITSCWYISVNAVFLKAHFFVVNTYIDWYVTAALCQMC